MDRVDWIGFAKVFLIVATLWWVKRILSLSRILWCNHSRSQDLSKLNLYINIQCTIPAIIMFYIFSCPKPPHRLAYSFEQKPAACGGTSCDAASHSPHGEFLDEDEDCQDYHKNGHVLVKAWDGQCVHFKIEYFPKDSIINAMDSPDTSSLWISSLAAPRHLLRHGPH